MSAPDVEGLHRLAQSQRHRLPNPLPGPFAETCRLMRGQLGALPVEDIGGGLWAPLPVEDAPRSAWRVRVRKARASPPHAASWAAPGSQMGCRTSIGTRSAPPSTSGGSG